MPSSSVPGVEDVEERLRLMLTADSAIATGALTAGCAGDGAAAAGGSKDTTRAAAVLTGASDVLACPDDVAMRGSVTIDALGTKRAVRLDKVLVALPRGSANTMALR